MPNAPGDAIKVASTERQSGSVDIVAAQPDSDLGCDFGAAETVVA